MRKIYSIKKYLFFCLFIFVGGCVAQGPSPSRDRGWEVLKQKGSTNDFYTVDWFTKNSAVEAKVESSFVKAASLPRLRSLSSSRSAVEAKVESSLPRASEGRAVVIPIGTIGNIKESQKSIITNKFLDELSSDYDIVPQAEYEKAEEQAFQELEYEECTEEQCIRLIQEMLQVENMFKLELIREDSDTQVSLTLIDVDKKLVKSDFCENCKTSDLIKVVSKLYKELKAKM